MTDIAIKRHVLLPLALAVAFVVAHSSSVLAQPPTPLAIVAPAENQTVQGDVTIQGTATSPVFSRYEVAYAQEPDLAVWIVIGNAVQPVQDGALGVWNTRAVSDGPYALRLQVFGSDGSISETIVRSLTLANAPVAPTPAISTLITDTATEAAPTTGVVAEVQTARDTLQVIAMTLSELPAAFIRGARIATIGFVALGAYLVLKKVVLFAIQRLTRRPGDYGG